MESPTVPVPRRAVPVGLLAFTAAAAVANLYYSQPLLPQIGRALGVAGGTVGLVATITQVGYALGILIFVPLGDTVERRRLIVLLTAAVAVALAGMAAAPSIAWLAFASLAVGVTTVVPQLIVPFAAGLSEPGDRGRVVGAIMGGLLVGILAARVLAGLIGGRFGWRVMFVLAAAMMSVLAVTLARVLPHAPPRVTLRYRELMASLWPLARAEPVLRDAALLGALVFVGFSALWTTLAFRLELAPLHYGSAVAGAFGLIGIVGAAVAPLVGRLADKRAPRATIGIGLAILGLSYLLFWAAGHTLVGLVLGVILVDAGMQVVNISNQARIFALREEVHSRLNTVYMVSYFTGGSLGSALGVWAWSVARWSGVCALTLTATASAAVVYMAGRRRLGG